MCFFQKNQYDIIISFYSWFCFFEDRPRNIGLNLIATQQKENIVDVGCGTGETLLKLAESVKGKRFGLWYAPFCRYNSQMRIFG